MTGPVILGSLALGISASSFILVALKLRIHIQHWSLLSDVVRVSLMYARLLY